MKISSFRLPDKADRLYSGQVLDRSRVIKFKLDGEVFEGFAGDTVLSALLANGVDTFGHYRGEPVGLDERLNPPIAYAASPNDPGSALSMSRTPIVEGMELISLAQRDDEATGLRPGLQRQWRRFRRRLPTSLSLDPESVSPFPGPWTEQEPGYRISADLIVVGGGAGGLAAARAGAERGWSVILVERLATLGGDATFFGSVEEEARASTVIEGLVADIKSAPGVEILTRTEVLGISGGILRAHQTLLDAEHPSTRVIALDGRQFVFAPGAHERLPLFAGNRLPGVSGARAAHRLAENYGVWRGTNVIINTASSAATQVALEAADLGIDILKLTDSRAAPQSHFFDFAKAYGVLLATGLRVAGAELADRRGLNVRFELAGSGKTTSVENEITERLLICGGWQSDLTLWHMAGGRAGWDEQRQQLRAVGNLDSVALAGWCSGAKSMTSCIASGEAAVSQLAGARVSGSDFIANEPDLESDDGQLPVSLPIDDTPACYLDNGFSFSTLLPKRGRVQTLVAALGLASDETGLELRALSLNDVSAKVILGEITPAVAGHFAKERCIAPGEINTSISKQTSILKPPSPTGVPDFLIGRFGDEAIVTELSVSSGQGVEPGCLVFQSSSQTRPDQAIGVVIAVNSGAENQVSVYLAPDRPAHQQRVVARMGGRTVELESVAAESND